MAYAGKSFSRSNVGELEVYSFNFRNDIVAGETIASATWECSDPSVMVPVGPAAVSGTIVSQRMSSLAIGSVSLGCMVMTSTGLKHHLWSTVSVVVSSAP